MLGNNQESPEMKYIKQQLDRSLRELKLWEQKLSFETKEHATRLEQRMRVVQDRVKHLESDKDKQLASFHRSDAALDAKERTLKQRLEQLKVSEAKAQQEAARKQHLKGTSTATKPVATPGVTEVIAEKDRISRELQTLTKDRDRYRVKDDRDFEALKRRLENEVKRHMQTMERERMSLEDSGKRTMKGYTDRIERLKYTVMSLRANYDREKREFEIKERQRLKKESDQRAKFGNTKAHDNFASPKSTTPLSAPQEDPNANRSNRRLGGARW